MEGNQTSGRKLDAAVSLRTDVSRWNGRIDEHPCNGSDGTDLEIPVRPIFGTRPHWLAMAAVEFDAGIGTDTQVPPLN